MPSLRRLLFALLLLSSSTAAAAPPVSFDRSEVTVRSGTSVHRFQVEMAVTAAQRERGLMGRTVLAPDAGMLFVFEWERVAYMWMHDTPLSLDMLFLAADGRIVKIEADTTPNSDGILTSGVPVMGILELVAGTARRLGLRPGDRVAHSSFGTSP